MRVQTSSASGGRGPPPQEGEKRPSRSSELVQIAEPRYYLLREPSDFYCSFLRIFEAGVVHARIGFV
jgi:hypothetical protein